MEPSSTEAFTSRDRRRDRGGGLRPNFPDEALSSATLTPFRGRDGEPGNPSALPTDRDVVAFFASDFGLTGESKRYLIKVLK
jgi:hypothetical protein